MESNDSPEIPDRGETSDIPGLPSGAANTGKIGRGFGKNAGEWTGRVEISEEEIHASKRSMYGYILTYSRQRKNLLALCSQQMGLYFLHPQLPTAGGERARYKCSKTENRLAFGCPVNWSPAKADRIITGTGR